MFVDYFFSFFLCENAKNLFTEHLTFFRPLRYLTTLIYNLRKEEPSKKEIPRKKTSSYEENYLHIQLALRDSNNKKSDQASSFDHRLRERSQRTYKPCVNFLLKSVCISVSVFVTMCTCVCMCMCDGYVSLCVCVLVHVFMYE